MKYGIIDGGIVIQTMRGTYEPSSPWVSIPDAVQAGWTFDGTDYAEPAPTTPPLRTQLSRLEFRNKFTQTEKQALYTAKASNVDVEIFLDDLAAAEYVELTDPATIAAVQFLEAGGIIGTGRGDVILEGLTDGV